MVIFRKKRTGVIQAGKGHRSKIVINGGQVHIRGNVVSKTLFRKGYLKAKNI